jgi:hypothetical protein
MGNATPAVILINTPSGFQFHSNPVDPVPRNLNLSPCSRKNSLNSIFPECFPENLADPVNMVTLRDERRRDQRAITGHLEMQPITEKSFLKIQATYPRTPHRLKINTGK